jgi:hypothetical protein
VEKIALPVPGQGWVLSLVKDFKIKKLTLSREYSIRIE